MTMSKNCMCCKYDLHEIFNTDKQKKTLYLSEIFKFNLNDNVLSNIYEFLDHPYHKVIYECKSRKKPLFIDFNIDNERFGYYWDEEIFVCSECFKKGLGKSLFEDNKRLPYLRRDIRYFNNYNFNFHCKKESLEKINKFYLPKVFTLNYYRTKYPIKINGYYFISCY